MADRDTPSAAEAIYEDFEDEVLSGSTEPAPAAQPDDVAAPSPEAHADDDIGDGSPPRDERGRFAPKEPAATEAPPATPETTPDAATAAVEPVPEAVTDVTPEPVAEWTPFAVKVDREEVPIHGAFMAPEGLFVPTEGLPRVRDLISRGIHFEKTRRSLDQERRQIAEERAVWQQQRETPDDASLASRYLLEEMQALMENPEAAGLNPELFSYLYDRVERRTMAAKLERYESGHQAVQQQFSAEEQRETRVAALDEWITTLAQRPEVGGVLTPEHLDALRSDLLPVMDSLFVEHQGQLAIRDDVLWARIQREAATQKRIAEAEAKANAEAARKAKAAQEAARFNAATAKPVNAPATPKAGVQGGVTTSPKDDYDPDWRQKWHGDDE